MPLLGVGALLWMSPRAACARSARCSRASGCSSSGSSTCRRGWQGVTWNFERFTGPGSTVDPRRHRDRHDDRHAELERGRRDDARRAECGLADLRAGLRDDRRAERRNDGDDRAGDDRRGPRGAARGAGRTSCSARSSALLGMLFLAPLAAAADWVGTRLDDPDGVLALAAFSSIFKLAGIVVFFPFIDRFAQLIVRISGTAAASRPSSRLEPGARRSGRRRRARGRLAGDPRARARRGRRSPPPARGESVAYDAAGRSGPADRALPRVALAGDHRSGHDRAPPGPALPRARSPERSCTTTSRRFRRASDWQAPGGFEAGAGRSLRGSRREGPRGDARSGYRPGRRGGLEAARCRTQDRPREAAGRRRLATRTGGDGPVRPRDARVGGWRLVPRMASGRIRAHSVRPAASCGGSALTVADAVRAGAMVQAIQPLRGAHAVLDAPWCDAVRCLGARRLGVITWQNST